VAGALGVRTWLALSATPDWRWLTDRDDTLWYPSMRLFRQAEYLNWGPVFERMASELTALAPPAALPHRERNDPAPEAIGPANILDRIAALEVLSERLTDSPRLGQVQRELEALRQASEAARLPRAERERTLDLLREVHRTLHRLEGAIRECEAAGNFGEQFVELARSLAEANNRRVRIQVAR
jgi:hypothetical protein